MKHLLDEELVKKCLSGEDAAFEVLVKRYEKQIFSLAYRLCGDYDEAGDLAQEAFLHIYRVLNKFSDDRKFFPWMYRIMFASIPWLKGPRKRCLLKILQVLTLEKIAGWIVQNKAFSSKRRVI